MFNTTFGHSTIRNCTIGFGALFNGLKINRYSSNGTVTAQLDIPLAYSAQEKWAAKLKGNPDLQRSTSITLPRMAFQLVKPQYDPERKLNSNNKFTNIVAGNPSKLYQAYSPVPYNLFFELYLASKTIEDGLQMLEQILPYFTPAYNISINTLPELGIVQDTPVILTDVHSDDNYISDWQEERIVMHTLAFTLKTNLFGPVTDATVIKKVTVNNYTNLQGIPSLNDKYHVEVNPLTANKTDTYTLTESWTEIFSG
jgi:hypothetical protein